MVAWLLALHVLVAAFWVGAFLALMGFVVPAARRSGVDMPVFMRALMVNARFQPAIALAGVLTILSGVAALWILSGGFNRGFMESTTGRFISWGALAGILAIVTGILTGRLQQRGAPFAFATGALLIIALICMVLGGHA
jgi:putative copper export protein